MDLEKEIRYKIDKTQKTDIINKTIPFKPKQKMLDITFGYNGFDSLSEYGFICRIREKGDRACLEVKKKIDGGWLEQKIELNNIEEGINFLHFIGMKPYMYLKRQREVRKFRSLLIFIDELDVLGDFVEIEFQESTNAEQEIREFLQCCGIRGRQQDLYGDIINQRQIKNERFKKTYRIKLDDVLTTLKKEKEL